MYQGYGHIKKNFAALGNDRMWQMQMLMKVRGASFASRPFIIEFVINAFIWSQPNRSLNVI